MDGQPDAPAEHTGAELRQRFEGQRVAFLEEGPPKARVRRDRLDRLVSLMVDNADALAEAVDADFGSRPRSATLMTDVLGILPDIELNRARLPAWMKPKRVMPVSAAFGMPIWVESAPLGVVGVIAPWNFPVGLLIQPVAAAMAAGNRVMAKSSEITWNTGQLLSELTGKYFDPSEFVVIHGGPQTAADFSSLPFDHLFFTGSPEIGALVANAAAANLTPITLELGGKNPAVIGPGADIVKAAAKVVAARLANGGQVCLCPDEVYVPRHQVSHFIERAREAGRTLAPTVLHNPSWISIVNDRNFDRVVGLLDDAVGKGATKIELAGSGEALPDRAGRRIAPTLLLNVTPEMRIDSEEVFGPVLSVHAYDRVDDVIARLAERPSPLAAYWLGPAGPEFERFCSRTRSGGMTVDDFGVHCGVMVAPFGGVGRSGYGAYHGKAGFDTFTHQRTIVHNKTPMSTAKLVIPSYTPRVEWALGKAVEVVRRRTDRRRAR